MKTVEELIKELEVTRKALEKSCQLLATSTHCFNAYCPIENTSNKGNEYKHDNCPTCDKASTWEKYFLQKVREENV